MSDSILGQVRDAIKSVDLVGTSGKTKTYRIKTECHPDGSITKNNVTTYLDFSVVDGNDGTNGTNGVDGQNGINGADGYRIAVSNEIAGSSLLTNLNTIGVENVLAIVGRSSESSADVAYEQFSWGATLTNSLTHDPTASNLKIYSSSGTEITSSLSSYIFNVIYVNAGSDGEIPQRIDLGSNNSLAEALTDAYDLYKNDFDNTVAKFPFAFSKTSLNGYIHIFPNYINYGAGDVPYGGYFTYISETERGIAKTSDSGSTWSYEKNSYLYPLGEENSTYTLLNSAASYYCAGTYSTFKKRAEKSPMAVGFDSGSECEVLITPMRYSSTRPSFMISYGGNRVAYAKKNATGDGWDFDNIQKIRNLGTQTTLDAALTAALTFFGDDDSAKAYATIDGQRVEFSYCSANSINYVGGEHVGYASTSDSGVTWSKKEATLTAI